MFLGPHSQIHCRSSLKFEHGQGSKAATILKEIVVQVIYFLSMFRQGQSFVATMRE